MQFYSVASLRSTHGLETTRFLLIFEVDRITIKLWSGYHKIDSKVTIILQEQRTKQPHVDFSLARLGEAADLFPGILVDRLAIGLGQRLFQRLQMRFNCFLRLDEGRLRLHCDHYTGLSCWRTDAFLFEVLAQECFRISCLGGEIEQSQETECLEHYSDDPGVSLYLLELEQP